MPIMLACESCEMFHCLEIPKSRRGLHDPSSTLPEGYSSVQDKSSYLKNTAKKGDLKRDCVSFLQIHTFFFCCFV